jgi:ABC-type proline/glycine betaine transport system permease subunit
VRGLGLAGLLTLVTGVVAGIAWLAGHQHTDGVIAQVNLGIAVPCLAAVALPDFRAAFAPRSTPRREP